MPDRPAVKTQPVRRDELAAALGSPRLVKTIEHLAGDVGVVLPDAVEVAALAAESAQADATEALALIDELDGTPSAQIAALREEVAALRGRVAALEQGITA